MRNALAVALAAASLAAFAKPLYLTVPRSYRTGESPTIDVAFEGREPVELRVLKPDDVAAYLRAQSNLRRAYQTPPTLVNPGRALSRGLNGVKSPGSFLLNALGKELREALAGDLPERAKGADAKPLSRLSEGTEKLIGIPPGQTLVHSEWLNLDLGGAEREFNVPGFEQWGWQGDSGYQERRVHLAPLPPGLYVLQVVQGRIEGQVVLSVTDLAVQAKQTDGEVMVRVAGKDLGPVAGATVEAYLPSGSGPSGKTDDKGELHLKVDEPRALLLARSGSDIAVVDTDFFSTLAVAPDVFIYADRPIYKPGDRVQFRGLLRKPDSFLARLFAPKQKQVRVKLLTDEGTPEATAPIDEFGSFSGAIDVPANLDTGVLRLDATVEERHHQSEARVQQYVKPTFYLEVQGAQETVQPGSTIQAKIVGRRYAGGPALKTRYEVFLYRSLLDSPSWVDDSGMGGKGSAVNYATTSLTDEGKLSVPERLYSSVAQRISESGPQEDPWATAPLLDDNGEATVSIEVPALAQGEDRLPYKYSLTVRARDDQGTFATSSKAYFIAPSEVLGTIRPAAKMAIAGKAMEVSIRSSTLSGKALPDTAGSVVFVLRDAKGSESTLSEKDLRTGPDGVWRSPLPTSKVGTVVIRVTLKDKAGRPWSGEETALVIGENGEAVAPVPALSLQALGGVLEPGDTAELVALFPEGWGKDGADKGQVWVTYSGAGIFGTELVPVKGLTRVHRFQIESRFGSAVYASMAYPTATGRWEERTTAFRIVPRERTLTVKVEPSKSEAAPMGEQTLSLLVTDDRGRGVTAQVSVGVVDKAVYAIQSEFRPSVLDFFYPLARNNVASFQSAEFQGYGYGEALARLLRGSGSQFAAIKPPTRKPNEQERDTAYWNPGVVTDSEGHARVTFSLPSNQTLWTVTAVAADASGRFGEGLAEFASRGKVNVVASLPQFLRQGDEAQGSLRVAHGAEGKGATHLAAEISSQGALAVQTAQAKVDIEAQGERILPIPLRADSTGSGAISFRLTGGPEPISSRREIPVRPSTIEQEVAAKAWGGGELALELPGGAQVESAELVLQPSTVDAALSSVDDLLVYPYGCLEQLVSTTVPNLALSRTLEKAGALGSLDPHSRALLAEAQSRSVQGVQRILALEVKGGGFTWFGGYSTPDAALTLIALDGLSYAVEADVVALEDPRLQDSIRWIGAQDQLPPELEATRAYVLSRLQKEKAAPAVRALVQKVQPGDEYALALAVLSAEEAKVASEPDFRAAVERLVSSSRDAFIKNAVYYPDRAAFWGYPLRRVGLSALLGHAASFGNVDPQLARRRFIEMLAQDDLSTFDRSTAILQSLWLVEQDAKAMRAMPPPQVDAAVKLVPRGLGLAAVLPQGVTRVKVASFDGVASLRAKVRVPAAAAEAVRSGMALERRYYAIRSGALVPLDSGGSVSQGEEVYVQLTIDAHDGDQARSPRSAYYVIDDPVPAGFTPLVEDKAFRGAPLNLPLSHDALKRRSLSPEHATFFFQEPTWWSDSPRVIGYVMRAQFEGKFTAPPATAEDMYVASIKARTQPAVLSVTASKAALHK